MTVVMPGTKARTFNDQAGDVGYVPVGGLIYLIVFNSSHYSNFSLAQWMANTPKEVIF